MSCGIAGRNAAGRRTIADTGGADRLLVEPFVDAHVHFDYANTAGEPRVNRSGALFEAIEIRAERKRADLKSLGGIYAYALTAAR